MKEYSLSKKALNDYRTGAKRDTNLDVDVLKVKLNCLINASITVNKRLFIKEYVFGRCVISVNLFNVITSIKWNQQYPAATTELNTLFELYKQNGLNKNGNTFLVTV